MQSGIGLIIGVVLVGGAFGRRTAQCTLMVNPALPADKRQGVSGTISLSQNTDGGPVTLNLDISGFDSTDSELKHGFHVHQTNDFSNGCQSTGGHFNPAGVTHGDRTAAVRHVGDLGNIVEDGTGKVVMSFTDSVINFSGASNIIGRAIVIHALEDDLGLGGDSGSAATGNAGARLACCSIVETTPSQNKKCDLPMAERVLCDAKGAGACAAKSQCCWDAALEVCYTSNAYEPPCYRLPPLCEVIERGPCTPRRVNQNCGIGTMDEIRKCYDSHQSMLDKDAKEADIFEQKRPCCLEKCQPGNGPKPEITCADVYPYCDPTATP